LSGVRFIRIGPPLGLTRGKNETASAAMIAWLQHLATIMQLSVSAILLNTIVSFHKAN
jgi:hypothetical protein